MAERLDQLNTERREIEAGVRAAAMAQAEARGLDAPLVWAAATAGIPASSASSRHGSKRQQPPLDRDRLRRRIGKGSGRSVAGIDLGAAIQRLAARGC